MSYVWQRWLPAELRAAGLTVVEVNGWDNRGRPASTGNFDPQGQHTVHHTGSTTSASSPMPTLGLLIAGRSDLPGPLAQVGVGYDGTVYVIAAGRANHAGAIGKSGQAGMPYGYDGNALAIGDEVDTNGTQTMPDAQRAALVLVAKVVNAHHDRGSEYTHRHADISGTGKWDLGSMTTPALRTAVDAASTRPAPPPEDIDIMDADTKAYLDRKFDMLKRQNKATREVAVGALNLIEETVDGNEAIKRRVTKSKEEILAAVAELDAQDTAEDASA